MTAATRKARKLAEKMARETAWAKARRLDPAPMKLTFDLPWPPSVNHYWRVFTLNGRATVSLSSDGTAYRKATALAVVRQRVPQYQLTGRIGVMVEVFPPNRAVHDLDNLGKGIFDALKTADVIRDDGNIDELTFRRGPVLANGGLRLILWEIPGPTDSFSLPLEQRAPDAREVFA